MQGAGCRAWFDAFLFLLYSSSGIERGEET